MQIDEVFSEIFILKLIKGTMEISIGDIETKICEFFNTSPMQYISVFSSTNKILPTHNGTKLGSIKNSEL